jgi:hypothetical protein
MTLGSVNRVTLFDFTAILFLTVGAIRYTTARFAVGAPLARLRQSAIDGPFTETFATGSVLIAITAGYTLRAAHGSFGKLENTLRLSATLG